VLVEEGLCTECGVGCCRQQMGSSRGSEKYVTNRLLILGCMLGGVSVRF
jgi:hypothetical protein